MTNREDGYMTSRCTNWAALDVPTIWSTVSDEGDAVSYMQVTAWRETSEAIDRHATALRTARDELATGWPPDKNTAAQEFFDKVESVLLVMDMYSAIASTNASALHGIVGALDEAKTKMQTLNTEWTQRKSAQGKESTFNKVLDVATFWSDENQWKEDLNKKAATVMVSADSTIAENRQNMIAPDIYEPPLDAVTPTHFDNPKGPSSRSTSGDSSSNALRAPTISALAAVATDGPSGPILTGGVETVATHVTVATAPDRPSAISEAPTSIGVFGNTIGFPSRSTIPQILGPVGKASTPAEAIDGFRENGIVGREGVIGMTPASAAISPARRVKSSDIRQNRGINHPGGVIGAAETPAAQFVNKSDRTKDHVPSLDPDHPWLIHEGTAPVIAPKTEPYRHTAGPGVIGIDR
jgi:hypothetical protein